MFDAAVATAVEKSPEGEITNDENQTGKTNLNVLKGGFSTSDYSYKFRMNLDGTGEIFYSDFGDDAEEFAHEIKVEKLAREIDEAILEQIALQSEHNALENSEIENIREEIFGEMLEEVFWEEINQTLEDPFFRSVYDDGEWGEEFQTTRGTVDEFVEFLGLCVLTEREIISGNEDYLVVEGETKYESAGLSDCSYYTNRLGELAEIACEYFKPSGFRYDYNDGCYDRASGYSMSSESVSVSLAEASRAPAREKMLANVWLIEKLALMEIDTEKIERLTAF